MALSNEDKKDVKTHMGKALANKVSKVTKDYGKKVSLSDAFPGESRMDKLKSKVGSDNRKFNYGAGYKSMARNEKKGMSKETMSAAEKGDKGAFIRSFMK